MLYALAPNGVLQAYPYTFHQLRMDNPQVSFSADPTIAMQQAAELGVVAVAETDRPAYDLTKNVAEGDPVDSGNGTWVQVWVQTDASAEEITARQKAAADDDAASSVRADNWVKAFAAMTPAAASDYVDSNVTNLASAKDVLKKMAFMLNVLARRSLRD